MARLIQTFDATQFNPEQGGGNNLPVGRLPVVIIADEVIATKDNSGGYLALTLEVIDGQHKGATGVVRLNLYNQSPKAVDIANRQFSALCHVVNVFRVDDVAALHGIPFVVDVALRRDEEAAKKGYTEVKKFLYTDGSEPGKQNQQQNQPQGGNAGGWQPNQGQPQQQQQQQNNGGWNQPQQQGQQGQQQQGGAGGWQPNQQQNQPQNQPQGGASNAGGWQQQQSGNGTGGNPAWAR